MSSCLSALFTLLLCSIPSPAQLLVAAASDLASVQQTLAREFTARTSQPARFSLGSSGQLARQIRNGAPFDVFLSANELFVSELVSAGRLLPQTRLYALGRIALWSPDSRFRTLDELAGSKVLHIAIPNPAHAPYGVAARQAFEARKLWTAVQPRIVYGENVRQALQYAESGNAEAAVTAWSLVFDRGGVLVPDNLHQPIRQAGGIVAASPHRELASRFLDFLTGAAGRDILRRHGLFPPAR